MNLTELLNKKHGVEAKIKHNDVLSDCLTIINCLGAYNADWDRTQFIYKDLKITSLQFNKMNEISEHGYKQKHLLNTYQLIVEENSHWVFDAVSENWSSCKNSLPTVKIEDKYFNIKCYRPGKWEDLVKNIVKGVEDTKVPEELDESYKYAYNPIQGILLKRKSIIS